LRQTKAGSASRENQLTTHAAPALEKPAASSPHRSRHTLLIVDDDMDIRSLLAEQLEAAGYAVLTASGGTEMFSAIENNNIDLIILDLNLPGEDGLALCRESRSSGNIPIIMLTARSEAIDRVIGLEVGADDYITKPFEPRELVARVRSVMRRAYVPLATTEVSQAKRASFRGWTLDFQNRRLTDAKGRVVMLSGGEFSLLKFFVEHPNEVLTREQLLTVTGQPAAAEGSGQRADLQISRLRHKLNDNARSAELIMTIRGQGYVLAAAVSLE
jgi:two-component system OmpR family response regulator